MQPSSTRLSLFSRVRDPSNDEAWREFEARYGELIHYYCRGRGLQHCDAEDVTQVVLLHLSTALRGFRYAPERGRFREYLGVTARHAVDRFLARPKGAGRALSMDDLVALPDERAVPASADAAWEEEWIDHHFRLAMRRIEEGKMFDPASLAAFRRLLAGDSPEVAGAACGMSTDAVYKIRRRVRERLRALIAEQVAQEDEPDA